MTNDNGKKLKKRLIQVLESHPEGLTIQCLSDILGVHRQTVTKHLFWLDGAKIVHRRKVGSATLHYLKKFVRNFGEPVHATTTRGPSWDEICTPVEDTEEICREECLDWDTFDNRTVYCLGGYGEVCRNNTITTYRCMRTFYSGIRYHQNSTGHYVNPSEVLRITKHQDDITFHYTGIKGYYNVTFETGAIYNGNYYSMAEVKQMQPQIQFYFPSEKHETYRKYAINITNIPDAMVPNIWNITLTYKDHYGFTLADLKQGNRWFHIKDTMSLYFEDLREKYTLKINKTEKRIYISNISANVINGNLYLDPTIQLQDADTENLRDVFVDQLNPDTNYGSSTNLTLQENLTAAQRTYTMFNISSLPKNRIIDDAQLYLYIYSGGTTSNASVYHVTSHDWISDLTGQSLNESTIAWNNQTCGVNFDNSTYCNLTAESSNSSSLADVGWVNWSVANMVKNEYNNDDNNVSIVIKSPEATDKTAILFYSKEYTTDTTKRPYLNITYSEEANISDCTILNQVGTTYYLTQDITNSSTNYCMSISANNVTLDCQGNTIDGNDTADYGIYVSRASAQTTNITIRNCILTGWDAANVRLINANGNTLTNITSTSSPDHGFYLTTSDYNNFINCTANSNGLGLKGHGFWLISSSDYNTFTNCVANSNGIYGFSLVSSSNSNTFTNCTANSNFHDGFYLGVSHINTFTNCVANSNGRNGFYLAGSDTNTFTNCTVNSNNCSFLISFSNSNTMSDSRIENNTVVGIHLFSAGQTDPNKIYNNLFNNTNNSVFEQTIYTNQWNTTRQTGNRIYSLGTEIGGNYWTNPTGNGYSDTCGDANKDGFCDSNYTLNSINIDYLPLSDEYDDESPTYSLNSTNSTLAGTTVEFRLKWTDNVNLSSYIFSLDNCTGNLQNITESAFPGAPVNESWSNEPYVVNETVGCTMRWKVYANDTTDNWNVSEIYSFVTSEYPTTTTTTTTIHVGGGPSIPLPPRKSQIWAKITPGVTEIMKIDDPDIGLKQISINVRNQANKVKITVTKLEGIPASIVHEITGKVYKYIEIEATNLVDENISEIKIQFPVNKSWIIRNNINRATVALNRYKNNVWARLQTREISEDNDYVYYEAESPGLTTFAITGEEIITTTTIATTTVTTTTISIVKATTIPTISYLYIITTVVIVIIIVALIVSYQRKSRE